MDSVSLLHLIQELGLLEKEADQRQVQELAQQYPDARQLAGQLLQRDLLTAYQVNQLLTGKGKSLLLGHYQVLERLGEGGMGQVFKARHCKMHRIVALKLISKERCASPLAVNRFLREVAVSAALAHPNLVRAYDADQVAGTWYFAMQYIDGTDLSRLVKKSGPLAIEQACDYILQAALGLQHIAENNLVHRDIKPSNLMVTRPATAPTAGHGGSASSSQKDVAGPWGRIIILDLGLARLVEADGGGGAEQLTRLDSVMGTADYMSPEQAIHSRDVDIRSDMYSLGCTFYFLLTGQPPFPGGNHVDKLLRHQLDQPTPPESLRPEIPRPVLVILRKLMAKKREERFQTPEELIRALLAVADPEAPAVPLTEPEVWATPVEPASPTLPSPDLREEFAFDEVDDGAPPPPRRQDPALDWRAWAAIGGGFLAFAVGVALLLGIVLGLWRR